jgi:DNA polymerase-3 subunit delta
MDDVSKIVADINAKNFRPIYFLMGEEPYYIDRICEHLEAHALSEEEKGFNQTVVYGRDVSVEDLISTCRRYPMMADRQVVIVKEAQDMARQIDKLEAYAESPTPTTLLVMCYKYKTLDKRKKLIRQLEKNGLVYESMKIYEDKVGEWIRRTLAGKKYNIEPKATAMLVEFLGNDLSRISNELDKLRIIVPEGVTITAKSVEENIGISKDFNNFELVKALGERNQYKAFQIAQYFAENPKDNPIVVTTALVFGYFTKLLQYHGLKDRSPKNVAAALRISPYFVSDYTAGLKHYPMKKVSAIIAALRQTDVRSKGVGANLGQADLLREMLVRIFA